MQKQVKFLNSIDLIERVETQDIVTVSVGYQDLLEREVVVKRLVPNAALDPRLRGRFIREARQLAEQNHPNIAQVYDAGVENDVPYVVMERINGITAQQRLEQLADLRARMDIEEAVRIVRGIADAVTHIYKHGIPVHTLSLNHIMLTSDGRAVLTDLGQPLPENLLHAAPAALAYAAPERLFGGIVDERSCVYSLGVLLYHLLIGHPPFEGSPIGIIAQKQTVASLPALDDPHTDLPCPYAVAHVLRQATVRELDHRYAGGAAFCAALSNALAGYPAKIQLIPSATEWATDETLSDVSLAALRHAPVEAAEEALPRLRPRMRSRLNVPAKVQRREATVGFDLSEEDGKITVLEGELNAAAPAIAEAALSVPAEIDPLMPGLNDPALQAALPYTILVPMPQAAGPESSSAAALAAGNGTAAAGVAASSAALHNIWLFALIIVSAIAVSAAVMLG